MRHRGKSWLIVCGMAGLLPVGAALAADNTAPAGAPPAPIAPTTGTPGDPSWTAIKIHQINAMEVEAAKLEQQKGESPRVKEFAGQMVRDHQAADKQVMAYARKHKLEMRMPGTGEAAHRGNLSAVEGPDDAAMQSEMKKLEALKGAELDRAFLASMVSGHDKAIDLVRSARDATSDRDLANLLDQLLPSLDKHRAMAATLNNAVTGGSTPESR